MLWRPFLQKIILCIQICTNWCKKEGIFSDSLSSDQGCHSPTIRSVFTSRLWDNYNGDIFYLKEKWASLTWISEQLSFIALPKPSCVYMLTKLDLHYNAIKNIHPTFFKKKKPQVLRKKKKRFIIFSFFSAKVPSWLKSILVKLHRPQFPSGTAVNIPFTAVDSEHLFWLLYQQQPLYDRMWP